MKTLLYQTLGRASELLDRLRRSAAEPGDAPTQSTTDAPTYDRTGLTAKSAHRPDVLHKSDDLLFVRYDRPIPFLLEGAGV